MKSDEYIDLLTKVESQGQAIKYLTETMVALQARQLILTNQITKIIEQFNKLVKAMNSKFPDANKEG